MDLSRWPALAALREIVEAHAGVQLWLFGSALCDDQPADLDVLLVYTDLADIASIRMSRKWEEHEPPVDITAMTPDEEHHYRFVETTGAQRLI